MPIFKRINFAMLSVIILAGCASLPEEVEHPVELTVAQPTSTLSEMSATFSRQDMKEERSAVLLQETGWQALAQRLALIETAEHSIDIQYYIWNSDSSGHYLAKRLIAAADRGVKVRLMLDDINLDEREDLLTTLDSHPQIEIRVFNPIPSRRGVAKWLSVTSDFSRLNRRMHNKSFTVDGAFSIVGGRNIGDEYFDLSNEINFRDRDVLVMGPIVADIQSSYREYWNSRWSYPVNLLGGSVSSNMPNLTTVAIPQYKHYPALPEGNKIAIRFLMNLIDEMTWVNAHFVYDRPVPVDESDTSKPKATARYLTELAFQSDEEIVLESAYLIFDDNQLEGLQKLTDNGVEVKALTNSMVSNDLITNHSGYAGRRKDMLEHGMQLFELKPDAILCKNSTQDMAKCAPDTAYGLHAKSVVFDRRVAAIGSFNFNLRSTYLNTESLLIIENEQIAERLADNIEQAMFDENSWRLHLKQDAVQWSSGKETWDSEPETGQWDRIKSRLLQLLPIEKYL